jgi:hypothetical protein
MKKKPHVLFVTEKYADHNPDWLSNSHHNLFGSLECSELATYSNFFLEENFEHMDDKLITYHRRLSPDLTVITILPSPSFANNPTDRAFAAISSRSPVVFIWFDSVHKYIMDKAIHLERFATLNVALDTPFFIPREKCIHLWTPQDTRIYRDPGFNRDIDISFMGSMNGYADRSETVSHLMMASSFHVHRDGGQREHNLTPQDYAKVMQRSKISLSFSKTRQGIHQTKGRLWEITLCGAMLMEDVNQGTNLWFDPFRDYVPFISRDDLVDKTNYYLSNPNKLAEIAANAKTKSEMHYSPKNWWAVIFSRCGIQTSTT